MNVDVVVPHQWVEQHGWLIACGLATVDAGMSELVDREVLDRLVASGFVLDGQLVGVDRPGHPNSVDPDVVVATERICEIMRTHVALTSDLAVRSVSSKDRRFVSLMLRLDKLTEERITKCLFWVHADPFWAGNVLSTEKLRKQFPKLQAAAKRQTPRERETQIRKGQAALLREPNVVGVEAWEQAS